MAKQSFKDSIYQQIANSQVQQAIKDQRDQDYKLAQDLIAQYQPTNDDITLAQNLIAQYQQPAPQPAPQPEPVVSQPQVPVLKKQTGPTKEEKLKAFSENYARQQQEESMLQSAKGNAEKQAKREAAVKAGRDKFFGKEADAVVKQAKVNKVLSEGKKVNPVVGNRINQLDLSQYNLPSDGFTEEDQKTFANAEKAKYWTQPGYKMSKEEQKEAKRIAAEGKQALAEKYPVTNKADYGKLLDRMSPEDRENYIAFEDLGNKADSFASMSVGAADQAIKMGGGLFDAYALFNPLNPNAARSAKAYKELVQDNWNEKAEGMKELAQNAAPLAENVPVIGEITPYGAGKTAAQMGAYLLSDQAFSELGGMVSGGSKIGQFVGNQVGQNLQDVFLDSMPRYNELKSQGYSEEEIRNILTREGLLNFAGNGFLGVLGEVPGLVKGVGDNIAAKNAADAAFRENVRAGANRLSEVANDSLPIFNDADNIARNATKNIEQIPNLPDYVTGGPTGAYDVAKNIESEPIKDAVEEVPKKGAFTDPDSQKILDAYRNGERLSQYEDEVLQSALLEEKYDNLRRYSDDMVTVEKSDIPEDILKHMMGDNYDNQIDSVKLSAELAKRGFNLWENGFNNNIMANYSTLLDAVAHHLAADNIPAEIMAEAYDITYKNGGTLDDAIKLAAEMTGTKLSNPTYGEGIKLSAKAIEPVKETVEEVAKSGPELSVDTQEKIASDFEEIYNAVEDMRSIVESSGDAKIAEKYSKLQDAVWDYEKKVYQSDSLEEINKAKKAADAARQGFIRAAKKIDPNFKGSLTGTKLGNAEFRRTSTAPTDNALRDELVADWVKNDIENPNRFARDISKDSVPENTKKTYSSEELKELDKYEKDFLNVKDSMLKLNRDTNAYHKKVYEQKKEYLDYITEPIRKKYPELFDKTGDFKGVPSEGSYKLQTFAGGDTPKESWKTSQYYENSAKKRGYADKLNEADYRYRQTNAQEQIDIFNERHRDSKDIVRDLVEIDAFDDADMRGAMDTMDKLMNGSVDDVRRASRLGKKISLEGREGGRVVQAMSEAKANTPAGQLREAQRTIGDAIDKRVGEGTSEALDDLYEKVMKSYEDSANKEQFSKKLEDLLTGDLKQHVSSKTAKKMQSKQIKGLNKIVKMIDNAESLDKVKIDDLMNVMYKMNGGVLLSPQTQKEVFDLLKEASKLDPSSYEFRRLQAQAARKVMAEVPSGLGDYVRAFLYDNMLGNFKTAFSRNFIGNMAYQSLEKVRELPSAAVDKLVSLKTGKHSSLGWNKGKRKAYTEGFKTGGLETLKDIRSGVNTTRSGQTGWKETLSNNRTVHNDNSKLGHWANKVDFYVENAMKGGDRPVYEANYAEFKTELEQLLDRYGKDGVAGLEKVKDEDISDVIDKIAAVRAADAVFQKKGHMSEGLTKLRDGLGELSRGALGVDVLSTASTPFTLTPGNMLEKAVEYTPLGVVKNAVETAKELRGGGFNQRRFVEEAGRTITGLPVLGLAYAGAKNGIINGGLSEDQDEKQAQLDDGFIEYGLNVPEQVPIIGGKTLDTSDLPVYGPFAQAGAAMTEEGLTPNSMLQAGEAVLGGSATQGIRRAFGAENGMYSGQGGLLDNLKNTVMASGTQLVPSLVRQTAQTMDKYKRDLGEYGTNEYYLNSIKNSIPGLRQTLPIKTDVEGQPILQNQGRNIVSKALENYVLPMNMSEYKPSALNEEASRLLDATDKAWAFQPKALRKDLRQWDEKAGMKFTEKQFRTYKENLGKKNAQMGNALLKSDYYKKLDDEAKVEAMQSVYSAMKALAKENATGIKSDDKIVAAYKKGKEKGVVNYLYGNSLIEEAGISKQSNAAKEAMKLAEQGKFSKAKKVIDDYAKYKEISDQYDVSDGTFIPSDTAQAIKDKIAAGDTVGARQLAKQQSELQSYGFGSDSGMTKYQKAKDVIPGLTTKQFATTYKGMDANGKSGISQTEFLDYVNSLDLTPEQAQQYLEAYGGWENKEGKQKKLVGSSGHYDLKY